MINEFLTKNNFKLKESSIECDVYVLGNCVVKVGFPNVIIDIDDNFESLLFTDDIDILKKMKKILMNEKILK